MSIEVVEIKGVRMTEGVTMTGTNDESPLDPERARQLEESVASVREALTGLRYGTIALTIHEGRVVQIDVTEKRRLKPS